MTFDEARAAFPVLERYAYLNAGSSGPLARPTLEAMAREDERNATEGRGDLAYRDHVVALRERVREKFALAVGVSAHQVALVASTTEACRVVLAGVGLQPDDEIVTTDSEHFGLLGALHASGARVRVAPVLGMRGRDVLHSLLAEVGPRTRLLALQHVSWMTGQVLPVAELRQATGLPVLADGAQSAGAIPVDAASVDFYTVSAQKWLCGPDSSGALVVRDPEALAIALPSYFSQERYEPDGSFEPRAGAARFDTGWIGGSVLAGLETALDFHPDWRYVRAAETADRCRALLAEHGSVAGEPGHGTIVSVHLGDRATEAVTRARERGVVVREIPGTGLLRVSCGYWTSDDDLERLDDALAS